MEFMTSDVQVMHAFFKYTRMLSVVIGALL